MAKKKLDPIDIAGQLSSQYANFSSGEIPMRADGWGLLGREVRLGLDYLRYLRPEYENAPKLRERARREAPPSVLSRAENGVASSGLGRAAPRHRLFPPGASDHVGTAAEDR